MVKVVWHCTVHTHKVPLTETSKVDEVRNSVAKNLHDSKALSVGRRGAKIEVLISKTISWVVFAFAGHNVINIIPPTGHHKWHMMQITGFSHNNFTFGRASKNATAFSLYLPKGFQYDAAFCALKWFRIEVTAVRYCDSKSRHANNVPPFVPFVFAISKASNVNTLRNVMCFMK